MSTLQTKTSNTAKQWRFRFWIVGFTILLVSPFLLYYGYCWGLWGKNSLLLQYYFQCNCPASSKEWRYPKDVDVIVSACRNGGVRLSPSGRFLYVREENSELTSTYLLDLQTNDEVPINLPEGDMYFLTDDLIYIFVWFGRGHEGGEHIFDRTTNTMYPIKYWFTRPDAYINSKTDIIKLAESLREAKAVYFIEDGNLIVALAEDFHASPEHSFLSGSFDIPGNVIDRDKKFLQENNILYQMVPPRIVDEAVSQDGRFIARWDGIYLVGTNKKIVEGVSSLVKGWTYDGYGVIYASIGRCLLQVGLPFADDTRCAIRVPQPVLKLNVPEEYLLPTQTP